MTDDFDFLRLRSDQELKECFPILQELRPHLTFEAFIEIYKQAHESTQYEIVVVKKNNIILALMGYRILSDFVRGRHLYIDDLVTTEGARSQGLGAKLLSYAENIIAPQLNCNSLRLCTGINNERGALFYEKNNWEKTAFAYTKKIKL